MNKSNIPHILYPIIRSELIQLISRIGGQIKNLMTLLSYFYFIWNNVAKFEGLMKINQDMDILYLNSKF
jgi:hypothetical protein